jgi:hypothetical protein
MAKNLYKDKLIKREDIKERISYIPESSDYYISENGNVYRKYNSEEFLKRKLYLNPKNGYMYCSIVMLNGKSKTFRVHRLVALAFVYNDDETKNTIVMHKDNNKTKNIYSNLKWGTVSENTGDAFKDGLAKNDKGYEDSQSHPVNVYDLEGNLLYNFGSISECSKELGVSKSTISRQCKGVTKGKPRKGYVFEFQE